MDVIAQTKFMLAGIVVIVIILFFLVFRKIAVLFDILVGFHSFRRVPRKVKPEKGRRKARLLPVIRR